MCKQYDDQLFVFGQTPSLGTFASNLLARHLPATTDDAHSSCCCSDIPTWCKYTINKHMYIPYIFILAENHFSRTPDLSCMRGVVEHSSTRNKRFVWAKKQKYSFPQKYSSFQNRRASTQFPIWSDQCLIYVCTYLLSTQRTPHSYYSIQKVAFFQLRERYEILCNYKNIFSLQFAVTKNFAEQAKIPWPINRPKGRTASNLGRRLFPRKNMFKLYTQ